MGVQIRYMGAKHRLAPIVSEVIKDLPQGPCLDLFSGMCSVAGSLARTGREAWCNDIQQYAALVSQVLITSSLISLSYKDLCVKLRIHYEKNFNSLKRRFSKRLREEKEALKNEDFFKYQEITTNWRHAGNDEKLFNEIESVRLRSRTPYRLLTLTYSHGYFGLLQAIDLDSIRYAIDKAYLENEITIEDAQRSIAALLETASKICAAPGHFAQYLEPHSGSAYKKIRDCRLKNAWSIFTASLDRIVPFGNSNWRSKNRVFCEEASALIKDLRVSNLRPRIIYADPPYSEAQYSRYYHVLESIVKYDYPSVFRKGRYREDRFTTPFSLKKSVRSAFDSLAENSARLKADLVISYPSNGLLFEAGESLSEILYAHYSEIKISKIDYKHSTLGGRHGIANSEVEEMIFVARKPR
jgi:adenine-specific DNA-methyltransferase